MPSNHEYTKDEIDILVGRYIAEKDRLQGITDSKERHKEALKVIESFSSKDIDILGTVFRRMKPENAAIKLKNDWKIVKPNFRVKLEHQATTGKYDVTIQIDDQSWEAAMLVIGELGKLVGGNDE